LVLKNLRQKIFEGIAANEPISRIRLAEKCRIRVATVTEQARELLNDGLIIESGIENSTGGRKPVPLRLNPQSFSVAGIRVTRESIKCGLFSMSLNKKAEFNTKFGGRVDNKELLRSLKESLSKAIEASVRFKMKIKAVAVSFPGKVDPVKGIFFEAAGFPGPSDIKVKEFIEKGFKIPAVVDHDVAGAAIAEYYLENACVCKNMGVLFIDEGIGSRFVIDGKLFRGSHNGAGEFGHLSLDTCGPECYCGNRGCFEQLAGISAIERKFGGNASFEDILKRAAAGNAKALALFDQVGGYIGEAIVNIFHFMDLERIVVNGRIAEAAPYIEKCMVRRLNDPRNLGKFAEGMVIFSRLGAEIGLAGPGFLAAVEAYRQKQIDALPIAQAIFNRKKVAAKSF
jgi:predicted NBD/HSP70 family sugar kinase